MFEWHHTKENLKEKKSVLISFEDGLDSRNQFVTIFTETRDVQVTYQEGGCVKWEAGLRSRSACFERACFERPILHDNPPDK